MKNIFLVVFIGLLFVGCEPKNRPTMIDVDLIIRVANIYGVDLLNPANAESYPLDNIKAYYKVGDEWRLYYNPSSGTPKGFFIDTDSEPVYMVLYPEIVESGTYSETMLEWNEQDKDIIKCELLRENSKGHLISILKIWLNDELVWSLENAGNEYEHRTITILK